MPPVGKQYIVGTLVGLAALSESSIVTAASITPANVAQALGFV